MSEHLDFERHLAGESTDSDARHLSDCAVCRDEIARMQAILGEFTASARAWGEQAAHAGGKAPFGRTAGVTGRWLIIAAAALLLAAIPVYHSYAQREAAAQAKADAALLDAISADISRPAPEPLEPLIELVSTQGENR
jgi:hypothetical protein